MTNDVINGLFEFLAALAVLNHCRAVWSAKKVAGISILSTVFFACWGVWNLHYYPSMGHWASFAGGVFVMLANALWIGLMVRYRTRAAA